MLENRQKGRFSRKVPKIGDFGQNCPFWAFWGILGPLGPPRDPVPAGVLHQPLAAGPRGSRAGPGTGSRAAQARG